MGIIINDTLTLTNGTTATNTYASFKDSEIKIQKYYTNQINQNDITNYKFYLKSLYTIYINKEYRLENKQFLERKSIFFEITSSDLQIDPYVLLYNKLKTLYINTTDDI